MILDIIPQMSDATLATIGVQISKARIDWAERARRFVEDLKNIGLDAAHGLAEALAVGIRTGNWSQLGEQPQARASPRRSAAAAAAAVNLIVPGLGTALQPLFTALADKLLGWLGLGTRGPRCRQGIRRKHGRLRCRCANGCATSVLRARSCGCS